MLDDDRYCQDIVIQISAVDKSLKSLGNEILKSHLSSCVVADIKNNNLEKVIIKDKYNQEEFTNYGKEK